MTDTTRLDSYPSKQISGSQPSQVTFLDYYPNGNRKDSVEEAVSNLLRALRVNIHDPNFEETPRRLAAFFLEHFIGQDEVEQVLADCQRAVFPNQYDGMVICREINLTGLCPHHLLPVLYSVDIAYLPKENAIGLSKLHRLAEVYGRQPVMQETFTAVLADELQRILKTEDVAVVVRGEHSCMQIRGVKSSDAFVYTSELRGAYMDNNSVKEELYFLLKMK